MNESKLNLAEVYELIMFLQQVGEFKRSLILALAHIYPKRVTASELSLIAGYSPKSKYIYKNRALEELENENIINIQSLSKKNQLVQLNQNHSNCLKLIEACTEAGERVTEVLFSMLSGGRE